MTTETENQPPHPLERFGQRDSAAVLDVVAHAAAAIYDRPNLAHPVSSRIIMMFALKLRGPLITALLVMSCTYPGGGKQATPQPVSAEIAQRSLDVATAQIDAPYVYGGRGPSTFDCSGLITYSYKTAIGMSDIFRLGTEWVNDASMEQLYESDVRRIDWQAMRPGDIVFITDEAGTVTHGGFFVRWSDADHFAFVDASSYFGHVVLDTWPLYGEKRNQWFVGAGQLIVPPKAMTNVLQDRPVIPSVPAEKR